MTLDVDPNPGTGLVAEEVCGALSGVLHDGVDIHRCLAAQALGRIGDSRAVEPLIVALLDEDEDVRTDAAGALSTLVDPRAASQLMENLLGDPCTDVKLAAIDGLVLLGTADVVPWLRRLLKGRDEGIAWDECEFYENGWDDWLDIQIKAIDGLAKMGIAEAIPDIIETMEDENGQDVCETVFKALSRLGEPGVDALVVFLGDTDERCRRRAVAALGELNHAKAAKALEPLLSDPAPFVRLLALKALAAKDPSDKRLKPLFQDENEEVRMETVLLCGARNPDLLPAMLEDPSLGVQKATLEVLVEKPGICDANGLVRVLLPKLNDPDPALSAATAVALAAVSPKTALDDLTAMLADVKRPVDARLGALRGLAGINNEPAVSAIIDVIADKERPLRVEAMAALAAIARSDKTWPTPAAVALLQALRGELLAEEEEEVLPEQNNHPGAAADVVEKTPAKDGDAFPTSTLHAIIEDYSPKAEALKLPDEGVELSPVDMERLAVAKRVKGKRCMPVVPQVAPHQDIRRFAARVLGDLSHQDVAGALAEALSAADKEMRLAAADSLARLAAHTGELPAVAVAALLAGLGDADRNMRLSVVRALGSAGARCPVDVLTGCLDDDDSFVRKEAIRALSGMGKAGPEIKTLLGDPDPGVRLAAAEAVAHAGADGAVKELVDFAFYSEGYHRREASRLLRDLDVAAANALFLDALNDQANQRSWPVAIEALEELNRFDGSGKGQELERNKT